MPRLPDKPEDPKAAPVWTTETMPGAQNPPGHSDPANLPPPTPPADELTPPDAVKDGDGQDPPDEDDDEDAPEPRKRRATVLLPMKDGEPDMLGSPVDVVEIENNYQDCAKVRVSGTSKDLADLREMSAEHFHDAWDGR